MGNKRKAFSYGSLAGGGVAVGGKYGYTAFENKRHRGTSDIKKYWKENPEAHRFYQHKMAKGDKRSAKRLLNKVKKGQGKPINYFETHKKVRSAFSGVKPRDIFKRDLATRAKMARRMAGFSADEIAFLGRSSRFFKRVTLPTAGLSALGAGYYGYTRKKQKPKKATKAQKAVVLTGSAVAGFGVAYAMDKNKTKWRRRSKRALKLLKRRF